MTKEQITDWMLSMIPENLDFLESGGASYGVKIRRLEAVIRPLWGVLPLLCGSEKIRDKGRLEKAQMCFDRFRTLVHGRALPLISRPDRQIVVETGAISYGLGIFKERFLALFSEEERDYLLGWLGTVNQVELPENNWRFFRVLLNVALKGNGLEWSEECLKEDLARIDSWYLGDGWYSDGDTRQKDYYVAFGFHYYGMLYARMEQDIHGERFLERARLFAKDFLCWFDAEGRSVPFGRSLTYRFAHVGFWCEFLLSGAWEGSGLSMEVCKGLIFRNLEFWKRQPIMQPGAGNLTIGYGYGNLLLSEDYNAPGSPFWAFKTFALLEFPEAHVFWKCREEGYPCREMRICQPFAGLLGVAGGDGKHRVLLSGEQYGGNPYLYHSQEKYGKFAYSSYFGFNLTRGVRHIRQFAVDNALALSIRGHGQYTARERITDFRVYEEYLVSWWETAFARVCSYLIPLDGDAHVRIHELDCDWEAEAYEGGFPLFDWNPKVQQARVTERGVTLENGYGLSRITDLLGNRRPEAVPQGPNTNIYSCEPNGVPVLAAVLGKGRHVLACVVRGIPGSRDAGEEEEGGAEIREGDRIREGGRTREGDRIREETVSLVGDERRWKICCHGREIVVAREDAGNCAAAESAQEGPGQEETGQERKSKMRRNL